MGPVQRDVPQINAVVRVCVVTEARKAALPVADPGRHGEQVAQRNLSEVGILRRQLGQVVGHRILDASDPPLVDRDPNERRHERLRGGERGQQTLARRAAEVALVHETVVMDDHKREGLGLAQEIVERRPLPAESEVRLGARRKRTGSAPAGMRRAGNLCWSPTSDSRQIKARAIVDSSVDSHAQT